MNDVEYLRRELNRAMIVIDQQADEIDALEKKIQLLENKHEDHVLDLGEAYCPWLTPQQTLLLAAMARHGHWFSRTSLFEIMELNGSESQNVKASVLVQICNLRRKLKNRGIDHSIETMWGKGYRINEQQLPAIRALLWRKKWPK